jgi:hypothetical protein
MSDAKYLVLNEQGSPEETTQIYTDASVEHLKKIDEVFG